MDILASIEGVWQAIWAELTDSSQLMVLGQLCLSMILGGILGLEREIAEKPAGLRTHMLVAAVSTLLICLGGPLLESFQGNQPDLSHLRSDPTRIMDAVVTGISFLGAGVIIRQRRGATEVGGLTTAFSILLVGGVGMCVGLHQYLLAIGVTVLVVFTLRIVAVLEWKWLKGTPQDDGATASSD